MIEGIGEVERIGGEGVETRERVSRATATGGVEEWEEV